MAFVALAICRPSKGEEPTLRKTLLGHQGAVNAVAFAAFRNVLASASEDKTVKLWHLKTGKVIATLDHPSPVLSVAFDESGLRLVAGCRDGTVKAWNLCTGRNTATIHADLPARAVQFSSTIWAAWFGENHVFVTYPAKDRPIDGDDLWDLKTGKKVPLAIQSSSLNLDVSAASVKGWAIANNEPHYPGHPVTDGEISFTPAPVDGTVQFPVAFRGHTGTVLCLAFSPKDGKWLLSGSVDKTIKMWCPSTRKCTATLTDHGGAVSCLEFSRDGRTLASGSSDATIKLWDMCRVTKR